ncbi:MAG: M28 family peptidase, partial [Ktedonobacteraceae bacterium]
MLKRFTRACLLWLIISMLSMALAPATFANNVRAAAASTKAQGSALAVPGIDPKFIYQQLFYMVTHFQQRESGYHTEQGNGHDGFANYWSQEMLTLLGDYGAEVHSDPFPVQGWRDRPSTTSAVNVEVTVPGILHPEQVVVIGCHYDGEAVSTQSANDDASGCAIELGVAKAMSEFWHANHVYPARTLRFVIFDAEEQGVLGSFHYVNSTVNGDLKNIVAMFNEEQNGIAYPLRYLGEMSNPLMPFYVEMSPLGNSDLYPQQNQLSAQQQANITQFRQLMQQAVIASFQQFQAMGDQMLTYHNDQGQDIWQPIFTPDHLSYIHQEDDTSGGSDQIPFTLAGLPCATFVGNSTYYNRNAPPGSYPFDQPEDTIQLMNTFANGNSQQSQALTIALALPGMLTTWMLSQPAILGQQASDNQPIATISSIGLSQPGQTMHFDAGASYDPT